MTPQLLVVAGVDDRQTTVRLLQRLQRTARALGLQDLELVYARVPLLKYCDPISGLPVDLSINSNDGQRNTVWICAELERLPLLRPLVVCLKCLLLQSGLCETRWGGIGSYLLFVMVWRFLTFDARGDTGNLGGLLIGFLAFYAALENLCITDPKSEGGAADLGGKAHLFGKIRLVFRQWHILLSSSDQGLSSILAGWPLADRGRSLQTPEDLLCVLRTRRGPPERDLGQAYASGGVAVGQKRRLPGNSW